MEKGQVVQRGTHETMKRIDGPYARLIEDQAVQQGDLSQSLLEFLY
jgi:ABC-type multidrug transport system fused ATPase/permease subunit